MKSDAQEEFTQRAQAALAFSAKQLRQLITQHPDYFPLYTVNGKWKHDMEAWTNWCEGFLGGMLWIIYRHTGDAWWRERAEHYSLIIEHRKTDRDVHDSRLSLLTDLESVVRCDERRQSQSSCHRCWQDLGAAVST